LLPKIPGAVWLNIAGDLRVNMDSGADRAVQQRDAQEANQDGKADDQHGRAFLLFHCLCSLFENGYFPGRIVRDFPAQFAGLNEKKRPPAQGLFESQPRNPERTGAGETRGKRGCVSGRFYY